MSVRRRLFQFAVALVFIAVSGCGVGGKTVPAKTADDVQSVTPVPVVIVLDSSISMATADAPGPRIDAARRAVTSVVSSMPDDAILGLTIYGGTVAASPQTFAEGCRDVQVAVPLSRLDRHKIGEATAQLSPRGFTPIAAALTSAAHQLPVQGPAAVVLVSDGESTCEPDPCQAAADIKLSRPDVTISTIGFRTGATVLSCVTDQTGGLAVSADNAEQLESRLAALQDPNTAARALTPDGVSGATVGMAFKEVHPRLEGFPAFEDGRRVGDRVVIRWLDCDWVFDSNRTLIEIRAQQTIDGVGEGVLVSEADRLYGKALQETTNPGSTDSHGNAVAGGHLRLYSTGREDSSAWRITTNHGHITTVALCNCRPHTTSTPTKQVSAGSYYAVSEGRPGYFFLTPDRHWRCAILPTRTPSTAGCQPSDNKKKGLGLPGAPSIVQNQWGRDVSPNTMLIERGKQPDVVWLGQAEFWQFPVEATRDLLPASTLSVAGFTCAAHPDNELECRDDESGRGFSFSPSGYRPS